MIDTDTVFILGAGASVPYGYQTGAELRAEICSEFQGKYDQISPKGISGHINFALSSEGAIKFAQAFKKSSTPSIDLFLARNPEYSEIGKIAIVLSILDAERKSEFREDIDIKFQKQDWYSYLYRRMTKKAYQS